jgi:hypothetical protein
LNIKGICVSSGWLEGKSIIEVCQRLIKIFNYLNKNGMGNIAVGIDGPRSPLIAPRQYCWDRKGKHWIKRHEDDRGYGRHCEFILKSLKIANPQYTPIKGKCPSWMELGFALFSCLENRDDVFEVFPAASYSILKGLTIPKVTIDFANFSQGPKDMIDACVSAITVLEYLEGRGSEVGGGDGLGSIILPGPLPIEKNLPILQWPD